MMPPFITKTARQEQPPIEKACTEVDESGGSNHAFPNRDDFADGVARNTSRDTTDRSRFRGQYPVEWRELSALVKAFAGHRCVRCKHPFTYDGVPVTCDELCDPFRGRLAQGYDAHDWSTPGLNFTVHHLDGDKSNGRWWNLLALCNSCHLSFQARVIPEQGYALEHSPWFKVYAAGFYAWHVGQLEPTRREVEGDLDRFLALGQPHLYPAVA